MGPLGWTEMVVIFFVALVVLGPKKLPELGKTLGKGLREFRRASDDLKASWHEQIRDIETPVHDIKQSLQDVKAEVEAEVDEVSATIAEEEPQAQVPEETTATSSEEKKPDAN